MKKVSTQYGLGEVLVGGKDHPRVDAERLRAADLLELEILQDP